MSNDGPLMITDILILCPFTFKPTPFKLLGVDDAPGEYEERSGGCILCCVLRSIPVVKVAALVLLLGLVNTLIIGHRG